MEMGRVCLTWVGPCLMLFSLRCEGSQGKKGPLHIILSHDGGKSGLWWVKSCSHVVCCCLMWQKRGDEEEGDTPCCAVSIPFSCLGSVVRLLGTGGSALPCSAAVPAPRAVQLSAPASMLLGEGQGSTWTSEISLGLSQTLQDVWEQSPLQGVPVAVVAAGLPGRALHVSLARNQVLIASLVV